ncbi:MAG: hypothetical protein ABI795_06755 [Chthoniobacterales bacterium]
MASLARHAGRGPRGIDWNRNNDPAPARAQRALIVHQHGYLNYHEGTACTEVLKAGASKEPLEATPSNNPVARRRSVGSDLRLRFFG